MEKYYKDVLPAQRLSPQGVKMMEERFAAQDKAWELLELINAEFQSDPLSTQCFDARLVKQVKELLARRHDLFL